MQDLLNNYYTIIGKYFGIDSSVIATYSKAILVLLLGLSIAYISKKIIKKFIRKLDQIFNYSSSSKNNVKLRELYAVTISVIFFWAVIIYSADYAATLVEWQIIINFFDTVIHYFPKLIAAITIILGGFLISNHLRKIVAEYFNETTALVIHIILIIIFVLLGVEQIGVNIHFITSLIVVFTAAIMGCFTLALGLGAKTITSNIIGIQYAKRHISIGDKIVVSGVEGEVIEITSTDMVVRINEGLNIIPGKFFQEKNVIMDQCHGGKVMYDK